MIVNIRGTSGSGKSTLVRAVMDRYEECLPRLVEGRRRPLYYECFHQDHEHRPLSVLGHYETACGGCDTIPSMDRIYQLVRDRHLAGQDVLYEGLLISAEVNRCANLLKLTPDLRVYVLDVPVETCLERVNQRRMERDPNLPPVNPKNTISKSRGSRRAGERLEQAGANVSFMGNGQTLQSILMALKL